MTHRLPTGRRYSDWCYEMREVSEATYIRECYPIWHKLGILSFADMLKVQLIAIPIIKGECTEAHEILQRSIEIKRLLAS